jgi:hypothetical protein
MSDHEAAVQRFYGYELVIVAERTDGKYHDHAGVRIEVRHEGSGDILHVVTAATRSTHQLSKRYRPAEDPTPIALMQAERWVLENRPDAVARREVEREAAREKNRTWRRGKFEEAGRDTMAFIMAAGGTASTTEAGKILELGSARKLNPLLTEWGLQRHPHDAYEPIDPSHGEQVGFYGTLRWNPVGLKAIWDAAVAHGMAAGGDTEFVRRVRANTDWFDGVVDDASVELRDPA